LEPLDQAVGDGDGINIGRAVDVRAKIARAED
jgi:hypothetical protein